MALARHSDISLTMKHYTGVSLLDLKGAVARIGTSTPSNGRTKSARETLRERGRHRCLATPPTNTPARSVGLCKNSNIRFRAD